MHWLMTLMRLLFSNAAATRSLSANCLLTAISEVWVPGVISTVTLNRGGNDRNSFTRIDSPINVAMLQWGIVGVKLTNTSFCSLSTLTRLCCTTCNSSNVNGCSGSLINRIKSKLRTIISRRWGMKCVIFVSLTKYFTFIEWIVYTIIAVGRNTFPFVRFFVHIRIEVLQFHGWIEQRNFHNNMELTLRINVPKNCSVSANTPKAKCQR